MNGEYGNRICPACSMELYDSEEGPLCNPCKTVSDAIQKGYLGCILSELADPVKGSKLGPITKLEVGQMGELLDRQTPDEIFRWLKS